MEQGKVLTYSNHSIIRVVTHPGGAHKDEFLACSVLLSKHPVPIIRGNPSKKELTSPEVAVVDVGLRHEPDLNNFDHHQFSRNHVPTCSLSLVLQKFGLYEDALEFCPWLETAEWMDCRGPKETAEWLGIESETMGKLNSPLDVVLLKNFAAGFKHLPGEPIWEVMRGIGTELIDYIMNLRDRVAAVAQIMETWELASDDKDFKVLFVPRTDPELDEVSNCMGWRVKQLGWEEEVVALVYPDSRGEGYGMRRFNDSPVLDFSRLADQPEIHFAHNRGFLAKTCSTDIQRLKKLVCLARTESLAGD